MQIRRVIKFLLGVLIYCQLTGMSKGEKTCNRAIANYAKKMEKEGFILTAEGGGESKEPETFGLQKTIIMSFKSNEFLDITNGRKAIIYIAKDFLKYINSCERAKPYLINHHFEVKNLGIIISSSVKSNINRVMLVDNKICYLGDKSMQVIHEETFDEAVKLVNEQCPAQ